MLLNIIHAICSPIEILRVVSLRNFEAMISKALYEFTTIPVLILSITLIFFTFYQYGIKKSRNKKVPLPPGPRGLPIVGNIPFLDRNLHTYFTKLTETYGPIFKLQLGSKLCVVWNSASIVKEAQKEHDIIFANRDVLAVAISASYGGTDMVWSPYGEHWRMLRKICVRELLNNTRLDALSGLRRKEVQDMVKDIYSKHGNPINIGEYILVTMFHLITSMLWGGTKLEKEDKDGMVSEFVKVIHEISELHGQPNLSDYFPVLARFDLQGLGRKAKRFNSWLDRLLENVITQREKSLNSNIKHDDFLQLLLKLKDQEDQTTFSRTDLKTLLEDMLVAATKTSSTAIEWVMTELIKHPKIMEKVQDEIKEVVGMGNMVEESHLLKLNYLNAVVKEVMRLHPVIPLILRSSSASVLLGGYLVPKDTKILVNVWAIQRDPQYWDDPLMFKPDRFLNSVNDYDYKGTNFNYLPFGTGRRVCVGIPIAEKMVPYLLASLLHSFNWKLPDAVELDLSETFGLELVKTIPLLAFPTPRLSLYA